MKILILHNFYRLSGGEDAVVAAESEMLQRAGHEVHLRTVTNDVIEGLGNKISTFIKTPYDRAREEWVEAQIDSTGADVVHIHNFFPLLTPAVHAAANRRGLAVVQTLHNYRLICANALLLRDGKVCEDCVPGNHLWGVVHRCYRGSLPGSIAVTSMQASMKRHWDAVHRYIALTDFGRNKLMEGGLDGSRIVVKPNFLADSLLAARGSEERERSILFVGRLSAEKGADVLVAAAGLFPDVRVRIVGDGPDGQRLRSLAPPNVSFLGRRSSAEILELMRQASFLVVPSICYEGFPAVIPEAFSAGTPVIASRLGSLAEIVVDRQTGLHFASGDAADLVAKTRAALDDAPLLSSMRRAARATFEEFYSEAANLAQLEQIYRDALNLAHLHD